MYQKLSIVICLFLSVQILCDATECQNNESHTKNQYAESEKDSCSNRETKSESIPSGKAQRTFCMIKPDGVQRNLIGEILKRFEVKGLKLVALKFLWPVDGVIREHYQTSTDEPFFEDMIGYVKRGPVVVMVWEGYNAISIGRQLLTGGNKYDPLPGSIRGDYSSNDLIHRFTVTHGSDSVEEAEREISLWFKKEELISWQYSNEIWIYQK